VENKAGATSDIAAEFVARSAPDGHTLFLASTANTVNRSLRRSPSYDVLTDFAPVGLVATTANVLVVHPGIPVRNFQEFIAYAKSNPDRLSCASSGVGSTTHLSCELFNMAMGTDILHVPYRGSAPALTDLLGGEVTCMFDNMPTSLPHIRSGRLNAMGVTTVIRSPLAPDIPTLSESGLPDFAVESWFGLLAPAGTPPETIARLDQALRRTVASAELRHAYAQNGYVPPPEPGSPNLFGALIASEVDKWGQVIKAAGLSAE
jgi:tripartite-type tricarboxylate transporter receptor subunit TctC